VSLLLRPVIDVKLAYGYGTVLPAKTVAAVVVAVIPAVMALAVVPDKTVAAVFVAVTPVAVAFFAVTLEKYVAMVFVAVTPVAVAFFAVTLEKYVATEAVVNANKIRIVALRPAGIVNSASARTNVILPIVKHVWTDRAKYVKVTPTKNAVLAHAATLASVNVWMASAYAALLLRICLFRKRIIVPARVAIVLALSYGNSTTIASIVRLDIRVVNSLTMYR